MKRKMKWYALYEKMPEINHHILVELDDYSIVSGNMSEYGGITVFCPDIHGTIDKHIGPEYILRWCKYPEDMGNDD